MITYTVWYKQTKNYFTIRNGWQKIKNVKGDGIIPETGNRFLVTEDETRYELPKDCIIKFSKERWYLIKERMSDEAGQDIRIAKG